MLSFTWQLSAVYGTAKNHGGAINVTSEIGNGSTFRLFLPLISEGIITNEVDSQEQDSIKGVAHVLLVEDEEIICNVAVRMLEKLGYSVTVCMNGADAVEVYRKRWKEIDLVQLDVIMPVMDGEEAFAALSGINPDIITLLSSGYSIDRKTQNIIDNGAKGFIQKPYRKGELSVKLDEILRGRINKNKAEKL